VVERKYNFLEAFKVLRTDLITNDTMLDPKLFHERINSISEEELEENRKQFVRYLLEDPSAGIFFIFSLANFERDQQ
jgi:hypothetical protein